jgi:hypothetical protein
MEPVTRVFLSKVLKALYSAAVAFLRQLTAVLQGTTHFSDLTDGQWSSICLFTLVAADGTFGLAGWAGPKINGHSSPSGG